jgi:hypothetical protein
MVMTALAMSQAEVDMLPPHQRAIFMQLVCFTMDDYATRLTGSDTAAVYDAWEIIYYPE